MLITRKVTVKTFLKYSSFVSNKVLLRVLSPNLLILPIIISHWSITQTGHSLNWLRRHRGIVSNLVDSRDCLCYLRLCYMRYAIAIVNFFVRAQECKYRKYSMHWKQLCFFLGVDKCDVNEKVHQIGWFKYVISLYMAQSGYLFPWRLGCLPWSSLDVNR